MIQEERWNMRYEEVMAFIESIDEDNRHPKESALIKKAERDIVRKTFVDAEGLRTSVYASLVRYLEEKEYVLDGLCG